MDGILIINKPKDITSRDVVNIVSRKLNIKKIGHTGTLDPMATGVLVLCIGKATKLVEILTSMEKEYIAEVTLGINTDTLDSTGNILEEEKINISKEKIIDCLNSMVGTYEQEVPIYSAVKIKGRKLYEYARNNEDVKLPKRQVEIKNIELINEPVYINDKTIFQIKCLVSKGTYIRSLVKDIASKLDTIGIMSKLNRVKQGEFSINDSYTLEDIENGNYDIIDMEKCLLNFFSVDVNEELKEKIKNGSLLPQIYNNDVIVFKYNNKIISIYKTYEKDKTKIKPWKMF